MYYASDFELKIPQRVRLWIKRYSSYQILNWKFYVSVFDNFLYFWNLKFKPSPTTCSFHIIFLHITMYSYNLQYLRQLDKSIRHRSNNKSCTRVRKDLDYWFRYGVPLYSLYGLDICRKLLLPVKLMKMMLELLLSHTCLTSSRTVVWYNETRYL